MSTITAILPTYNRADTLDRALDSVFAQTRVPDEVLVVDDASTDDTRSVVAQYPRAVLVKLERNGGAGAARNEGIRRARGDWLAFLDSDDAWEAHKLEAQMAAVDAPPGPELICTGITVNERNGSSAIYSFEGLSPDGGWTFAQFQNYPFCPSTWLIRRSVFETTGLFDAAMPNCEDLDLLARMAGRHRMRVLAEPLVVKYNLHDSRDAHLERTAASYEILLSRHRAMWARAPRAVTASCVRLATLYMRAGAGEKARALLWRAILSEPGSIGSWALLVATLLGQRNFERVRHRVARIPATEGW